MGDIGIYLIKNKSNGKSYIGKSMELQKRIEAHKYKFQAGKEIEDMQEVSKIIDLLEAWYIIRFGTAFTGYNTKIGSFNDKEKAFQQCISPDMAQKLLQHIEPIELGETGRFFLDMVCNGLKLLNITPEWLYLKLKSGEL